MARNKKIEREKHELFMFILDDESLNRLDDILSGATSGESKPVKIIPVQAYLVKKSEVQCFLNENEDEIADIIENDRDFFIYKVILDGTEIKVTSRVVLETEDYKLEDK